MGTVQNSISPKSRTNFWAHCSATCPSSFVFSGQIVPIRSLPIHLFYIIIEFSTVFWHAAKCATYRDATKFSKCYLARSGYSCSFRPQQPAYSFSPSHVCSNSIRSSTIPTLNLLLVCHYRHPAVHQSCSVQNHSMEETLANICLQSITFAAKRVCTFLWFQSWHV